MSTLYDPINGHAMELMELRPDGRGLFKDLTTVDRTICDPHELVRYPFGQNFPPHMNKDAMMAISENVAVTARARARRVPQFFWFTQTEKENK